ncbi:MAG: coproporphyrinogen III oxidase family protein [Candidatus Omnitrophica bacterium]|nr:coproporphyrinogen III oxidase family protein [Candidatus Omnitrophota bacterium]
MSELIRRAHEYLNVYLKNDNPCNRINRQLPYTKYTTFMYGYMPLPYYALHSVDIHTLFNKNRMVQKPVLIYLHIPFCAYKCSYCYYLSTACHNKQVIGDYIDTLLQEIELVGHHIDLGSLPIHSIHIGGGTPTCLDVSQLDYVFSVLKRKFAIDNNTVIHCESSPDTIISEGKLQCLKRHGVRHLDIGIQTFQDSTLALVNRRHTKEMAQKAVMRAQEIGMEEINIDMLINLPDQTPECWEEDLKTIVSLRPTSVTIYCNALKTPHMLDLYYSKRCRFPSVQDVTIMNIMAYLSLREEGYRLKMTTYYSLRADGDEQKEDIPDVLSFGPRTWSLFNDTEYYNTFDLNEYVQQINKKKLPICVGAKISARRKLKQIIASRLQHVSHGVSKELWDKYKSQSADHFSTLEKIERQQLVARDHDRIKLSLKGIFFADDVFKEFHKHHERESLFLNVVLNNVFLRKLYFYVRSKAWSYKAFIFLNKLLPKIKM